MGVIVVGTGGSLDSGAMAGCCTPSGYRKIFGERTARRDVRKYRRRGLDRAARKIVGFLAGRGVAGDSVLEVGGGVGAIQLELLKAGAARATNVELSPEYEPYAAELLGGDTRVERRVGDFVRDAAELEPADDVVLHRVVCCYPDPEALVGAAAEHARRRLVLSFPPDTALFRAGSAVLNAFLALTRTEFRTFVHPAAAILAPARAHGLEPALDTRTRMWRIVGFERRST
jgi:magnesium-protoporphyrin O-methyltransferase